MKTRIGKFQVTSDAIREHSLSELLSFFGGVVPVHIEHDAYLGVLTYTALSVHFDEIPEGGKVPWYDASITVGEGRKVSCVHWRRRLQQ